MYFLMNNNELPEFKKKYKKPAERDTKYRVELLCQASYKQNTHTYYIHNIIFSATGINLVLDKHNF